MIPDMGDLIAAFQSEIRRGLAGRPASIAMRPAFVGRPSGDERGRFVTLDLGGTNVRATVLELLGDGAIRPLARDAFRLQSTEGSADDLFRPIARFVGDLLDPVDDGGDYTLSFIFAFPMEQTGIRNGRLVKWTKEFAFSGVEGEDVGLLLEEAIRRESDARPALRRIRVGALANDTVGALAAGAYCDPRCDIGGIVATGMNLAVAAPSELIGRDIPGVGERETLFNMECGNFDGVRSIQTEIDRRLDAESDTEGQLLEKMISGRYLGEIVRLTVMDISERGGRFRGWLREGSELAEPYRFTSEMMSDIADDASSDLTATAMLLRRLGVGETPLEDRRRLRGLCVATARRSARLVAMAIAATASCVDANLEREHVAAVDGSLFRGCPGYQLEVKRGIADALGERAGQIEVVYARDGSGLGAGVVAALAG